MITALLVFTQTIYQGCGESLAPDSATTGSAAVGSNVEAASPPSERSTPEPARSTRPSLVLITLDTTRADALGAYGQSLPTTPRIDALAKQGTLFEQVSTSNPETLPAHATLFTGKLPFAHGVRANAGYVLSRSNVTLAEVLLGRGYRTGSEVAAPVLGKQTLVTQGFRHYRGAESPGVVRKKVRFTEGEVREKEEAQRVASDITTRGIEFVRRNAGEPFFLWLHYFDAHTPYSAPRRFNARIPGSPYHAEVASLDDEVGRFIDELERLGLRENTLVVITADHGEGLGEHGEPTHSYLVYQSVMRVPLIFWGLPAIPIGLRIPAPVRTIDVAPTILELLSLPALAGAHGSSLVALLESPERDPGLASYGEATRFLATLGIPTLRFVRQGRWKYIHKVEPELYDVDADPDETENLAASRPTELGHLRERLEAMLAQAPASPDDARTSIDADTAAALMALGYAAESPPLELQDSTEALTLFGSDPNDRIEDVEQLSIAGGLLVRKEYLRALDILLPVSERNPESAYTRGLIADALLGLGRNAEAIAVLQPLHTQDPGHVGHASRLASALEAEKRPLEATRVLEASLDLEPCNEQNRLALIRILEAQRLDAKRLAALEYGATACPEMTSNLNNYAWALSTQSDPALRDGKRALELIREAIRLADPPNPAFQDTLAAALAEQGEYAEALRVLDALIEQVRSIGLPPQILAELTQHRETIRAGNPIRTPDRAER